jgi:hypothetical protein
VSKQKEKQKEKCQNRKRNRKISESQKMRIKRTLLVSSANAEGLLKIVRPWAMMAEIFKADLETLKTGKTVKIVETAKIVKTSKTSKTFKMSTRMLALLMTMTCIFAVSHAEPQKGKTL